MKFLESKYIKSLPILLISILLIFSVLLKKSINISIIALITIFSVIIVVYNLKKRNYLKASNKEKIIIFSVGIAFSIGIYLYFI